jgi:hypothetical protein
VWISITNKTYRRLRNTVSTCKKSHAKIEAIRCLKRYVAREIYHLITRPHHATAPAAA